MILVHGSNLKQKEHHKTKYLDSTSRQYLSEIRVEYDKWHDANMALLGPNSAPSADDFHIIEERVRLVEEYKSFLDQQKYAENFDSRSNLHSSVLEEFLYYLFKDIVSEFGDKALIGKSHTFKDMFFLPPNYKAMIEHPNVTVEIKDHDFVIGVTIEAVLKTHISNPTVFDMPSDQLEFVETPTTTTTTTTDFQEIEKIYFDIPAITIECKTYLDKTMLEGSSRSAEELKSRNPNAICIVVMEWLKLTENINLRKYKVDQIFVFRKQRNTDREFRFDEDYVKNPIDPKVVFRLFEMVRDHLTADWEGGVKFGLERGWLI